MNLCFACPKIPIPLLALFLSLTLANSFVSLLEGHLAQEALKTNKPTLLYQFSKVCPYCIRFSPDFKKYAQIIHKLAPSMQFLAVDCHDKINDNFCRSAFPVQFFPTVRIFNQKNPQGLIIHPPEKDDDTPYFPGETGLRNLFRDFLGLNDVHFAWTDKYEAPINKLISWSSSKSGRIADAQKAVVSIYQENSGKLSEELNSFLAFSGKLFPELKFTDFDEIAKRPYAVCEKADIPYTCSFWQLLHSASVFPEVEKSLEFIQMTVSNFLKCHQCRSNFLERLKRMPSPTTTKELAVWLSRVHSEISQENGKSYGNLSRLDDEALFSVLLRAFRN